MYVRLWKRVCDVIGAVLGLVITAPLWLLIALAIKLTSGGPILFWQKRVGRGKATFYLAKFRTMRVDAPRDIPTHLLDNPERHITGVGRLLRRMSIDELPQLINILRGEMSLVGPRPALWNQYDLIAERERYGANAATPGLTGWAQVNGRDELPISQKARLDGEYARRVSLGMDLRCMLLTIVHAMAGTGYAEGRPTDRRGGR